MPASEININKNNPIKESSEEIVEGNIKESTISEEENQKSLENTESKEEEENGKID